MHHTTTHSMYHIGEILRALVYLYIYRNCNLLCRVEWMKEICQIWSRGRHFSPSLTRDKYLKLSSQKRSPSPNLGEYRLVRRSGTTSRGTALLLSCLCMRSYPKTEVLNLFVEKIFAKVQLNTKCYQWPFLVPVPQTVDKPFNSLMKICLTSHNPLWIVLSLLQL